MKLTNDQIEILREGKIEENRFYLQWQLDRRQYTDINKVLLTIWLKWNWWKKAHIVEWMSEEELKDTIDDICETWEVETLQETIKKFQFYPTPKEVAEYLVELADLKEDDIVLEPSAWLWNIADVIKEKYVDEKWEIYNSLIVCELDEAKCEVLQKKYVTHNWDFLNYKPEYKFNKIIANPPFSKSQDVKHILHMYELLAEWGRIVSIASSSIQWREWKLYDELRSLSPEFIELPEWSFKESWTMVNTVIVVINK
jgi:hypothetical protein